MTDIDTIKAAFSKAMEPSEHPTAIDALSESEPHSSTKKAVRAASTLFASGLLYTSINQVSQSLIDESLLNVNGAAKETPSLLAVSTATSPLSGCIDVGKVFDTNWISSSVCAGVAPEFEHGLNVNGVRAAGVVLVRF